VRPWTLALILAACAKSAPPATAPAGPDDTEVLPDVSDARPPAPAVYPSPEVHPDQPISLYRDMVDHFGTALEARDLLIFGRTDEAREKLSWMATHDVNPALDPAIQMFAYGMKRDAGQVRNAHNAGQVGEALGQTLRWCGDCHVATDTQFDVRPEPVPGGDRVLQHMARHLWVANRLWDGLTIPSDEAWDQATAVLAEDAVHLEEVPHAGDRDAAVVAMAKLVHDLGLTAQEADAPIDKAEILGELYGTCADCHGEALEAQ
jgi:hypothetical protein